MIYADSEFKYYELQSFVWVVELMPLGFLTGPIKIRLKLSLSTLRRHKGLAEVQVHSFLILALNRGDGSS